MSASTAIAIQDLNQFLYGKAPKPVRCGRGLEIGSGTVIPEINFTLPTMEIDDSTWPEIRNHYTEIIDSVCRRALELEVPGYLVEFETLPPMTVHPQWGLELTRILGETLRRYTEKHGQKNALRLTPNDTREHRRPPLMRKGEYWEGMVEFFDHASAAGADMIAIESTGGKEVCDEALQNVDLRTLVFALGVLAPRDMEFLWKKIVDSCQKGNMIASGDTACGFANTAMVLADKKFIPKIFAAVVRVASVPRSLVAYEVGAVGPSKDCAYEGPYMKAIAGVPISMEGKSAACAHLSHVGNISQAVCDCWSNESVQNLRLLSTFAPEVYMEQLAYDCRLMNVASGHSDEDARRLRDWLVESDSHLDPQAYVLRPDVVLRLSTEIMQEKTPYLRTRRAVIATIDELEKAISQGEVRIPEREKRWVNLLKAQVEDLPEDEQSFISQMMQTPEAEKFIPEEYGL